LIPVHAAAVICQLSGVRVEFVFEMAEVTAEDEADIASLVGAFRTPAGDGVETSCRVEAVTEFGTPQNDVFGVYAKNLRLEIADVAGPRPAVPGAVP
jgi:hypothetical protein